MIRKTVLGVIGALSIAGTANAADIYRREAVGGYKDGPVYVANTWTGFYIGGNGGYAFNANDDQYRYSNAPQGTFGGLNSEGGFGGGQIGYNFGSSLFGPQFVFGIEADFQGSDISDNGTSSAGRAFRSNIDWFGTVRGRLGYAFDRTLVYATGGFAYADINKSAVISLPVNTNFRYDDTATGYTVGGGVETKVSPNWSLKVEYQYINLGENNLKNTVTGANLAADRGGPGGEDAFHTVRAGINYHFNKEYEPLK